MIYFFGQAGRFYRFTQYRRSTNLHIYLFNVGKITELSDQFMLDKFWQSLREGTSVLVDGSVLEWLG